MWECGMCCSSLYNDHWLVEGFCLCKPMLFRLGLDCEGRMRFWVDFLVK